MKKIWSYLVVGLTFFIAGMYAAPAKVKYTLRKLKIKQGDNAESNLTANLPSEKRIKKRLFKRKKNRNNQDVD